MAIKILINFKKILLSNYYYYTIYFHFPFYSILNYFKLQLIVIVVSCFYENYLNNLNYFNNFFKFELIIS